MKITKSELQNIVALIEGVDDEWRPLAQTIVKKLTSFGPELYGLFEQAVKGTAALKVASLEEYKRLGCTRQEAILLTLDSWASLEQSLRQLGKNK